MARAAGVLRGSKALKLRGTRSPTLHSCRAARILSYQPQSHLPYPQTHTPPVSKSSAVTTHSPGTSTPTNVPVPARAQPWRLSLVATCYEVGFSSQGRGSGTSTLATVRCPDRRLPRALCFKHLDRICRARQMETGCTFLTTSLSTFSRWTQCPEVNTSTSAAGRTRLGSTRRTPGLWCTKGLYRN